MAEPLLQFADALPDQRRRSDGRLHDTGLERPYRPRPADFRETYVEIGWETICEHYRTNWRCVRRWIEEAGREDLRQARAAHVREHGPVLLHFHRDL